MRSLRGQRAQPVDGDAVLLQLHVGGREPHRRARLGVAIRQIVDAVIGRARQRPAPRCVQGVGARAFAQQPAVEVGVQGTEPLHDVA